MHSSEHPPEILAYLAGAMDSDGYFTIKRTTYHIRVRGDASQPVFQETVGLKQVTPDIPTLLHDVFGGTLYQTKGGTPNSKPLWSWHATDKNAAEVCQALLPYLRVKRQQALLLLELRKSKDPKFWSLATWWVAQHPDWQSMELVTFEEAARMLGYSGVQSVSQAVRNGLLVALPFDRRNPGAPRIPKALVELVRQDASRSKDGRARCRPKELIAWRERLYEEVKRLNMIGVNGTPIYWRTGPYQPKAT